MMSLKIMKKYKITRGPVETEVEAETAAAAVRKAYPALHIPSAYDDASVIHWLTMQQTPIVVEVVADTDAENGGQS